MTFANVLALALAAFVVVPLVAHLLRRRKTETRAFAASRLVPAAPPIAKRRSKLEDRPLFALRALAILALALLGATPFVHCTRLSVGRRGGASLGLVLVVDDSLSMRAASGRQTRFEYAVSGARDVLNAAREGDGVALVAAGAPPRILLAATTDLSAANRALAALSPSDRGTDLDGALALAASLARSMPQGDKRVVLLSDLADGRRGAPALGAGLGIAVWAPLTDARGRLPDCAIIRADRHAGAVRARVACGDDADAAGRSLEARAGDRVLATVPLVQHRAHDYELPLPAGAPPPTTARLTGSDALADDDIATVVAEPGTTAIAVVSDVTQAGVATGGPPPIEQALAAIDESIAIRPLPTIPDTADDLAAYAAVVLDDPPGLTPEARAAFRTWMSRGGVGLALVGPRAGGAILGAAFEPFVPGPVRWSTASPRGADVASLAGLGLSPAGLDDLAPKGRALLEARASEGATILARWSDGAPLLLSRPVERGVAITATLSGSLDVSDFPLRAAFIELLDHVSEVARAHGGERRSVVGFPWAIRAPGTLTVHGPDGLPAVVRDEGGARTVVPTRAGAYAFRFGDDAEVRVAEVSEAEVDLTPRDAPPDATDDTFGSARANIDASPYVAFVLLVVIAGEALLRARQLSARRA